MSTLQVLDAGESGVALRIARAISGRSQRKPDSKPDIALVTTPPPLSVVEEPVVEQPVVTREIRSPDRILLDLRYDGECREVLAPLLDDMLDRFEAAGWNRSKVAYEMMHLAARRMNSR